MSEQDVVIYLCRNSLTPGTSAPALARQTGEAHGGLHVAIREVPCSGKTDVLYLLKAFEGGARGVAVITCPLGECRLAEGNYRAQVRVRNLGRLLDEIGLGRERLILLHGAAGAQGEDVPALIEQAVARLSALPANRLGEPDEAMRMEAK